MTVSYDEPKKIIFSKNLDEFYLIVKDQILKFQHPISGLFPLLPNDPNCKLSHVRDSVYCATVLWALHRSFARMDDDAGRHFELGQCAVKCMRTILIGWMQQSSRLEQFKKVQNLNTCLNSRLDYETGEPIDDPDYKNLQMDCVGLFVTQLAQMIASGLQIVYTKDEVAFMQNLVFYLERAYRIPDYGMWERGTKQNRNVVELNASSIGMAKAALESVSGLNVYGTEGSHSSVLIVDIDAHSRNRIILTNLLPRESASKGTDASLIPTLCWPAYGATKGELSTTALERCMERLKGQYGFRRFTRDGYATVLDQSTYYQPGELMKFYGIESEWPMFFAYMAIDHCMNGEFEKATEYDNTLKSLLVHPVSEQYPWLPKFFYVPMEDLDKERKCRGSVVRRSSFRLPGQSYFLWGQSVYIISQLLISRCLTPGDLDPLGRCPAWNAGLGTPLLSKPLLIDLVQDRPLNLTIQVVLISESARLQQILATYGVITQTPTQVEPIQIWPPDQLVRVGKFMGCSQTLGLSGRPPRPVGQLGTSRFYRISGLTVLSYPLIFEAQDFYLLHDMQVVIDEVKTDFKFLSDWWRLRGRPTVCFLIKEDMVKVPGFDQLLRFLIGLKNGTVHDTRVVLGRAQKFVSSGFVEHLDFLPLWTATGDYFQRVREVETGRSFRSLDDLPKDAATVYNVPLKIKQSDAALSVKAEVVRIMHAMDKTRFRNCPDDQLIECGLQSDNDSPFALASRIAALHELLERHDLDHLIITATKRCSIRDCLLDLSRLAGIQQIWCAVRLCAALLSQFVNSLAPSLSAILVCGKQVTIGVALGNEVIVNKPLNPDELHALLRESVYSHDPVQFSLQQEIILWVSSLLTSDKQLFNGITFIRLGWLLEAMKLQLESETLVDSIEATGGGDIPGELPATESGCSAPSDVLQRSFGACHLYSLPPCLVKDLLYRTLTADKSFNRTQSTTDRNGDTAAAAAPSSHSARFKSRRLRTRRKQDVFPHDPHEERPDDGTPSSSADTLFQRQLNGCLGRVPPKFYQSLYLILERSPHGVLIWNKLLPQNPTLTDMTPYDLNFVDEVEWLLRPIGDPAYRSLFVETVMVIAVILERNCELSFKDTVDINMVMQDAANAFAQDRNRNQSDHAADKPSNASARTSRRLSWPEPPVFSAQDRDIYLEFTATPPNIHMGTTAYLARAALDRLLQGQIDLSGVTKDVCCIM